MRPTYRASASSRIAGDRSAQLARSPAILDEAEARYVGLMFVLGAVILAGAAALTI